MDDKGLVAVTGASGFVASWLVKRLLEDGYRVRGTVRDPNNEKKTAHLRALPGAKERLELVQADLLTEGSFDAAVDGVEGVFHTASPLVDNMTDPYKEMIEPSVKGALNLLSSVAKTKTVKRVVLTSSSSSVRFRPDYTRDAPLDDSSWSSLPFCKQFKLWYPIAKTTAEEAAWDFAKKNDITLVTLCPTYIIGPILPPDISSTSNDVLQFFKGNRGKFFNFGRMGYVHLDDAVTAHILLYQKPQAEGRYIVDAGVMESKEMAERIAKHFPQYNIPTDFEGQKSMPYYNFDTSKLTKLGLEKYKSLEEMFDDALASFKEKGLL
ncbi:unnamed protein product [Calypogeia fissa]